MHWSLHCYWTFCSLNEGGSLTWKLYRNHLLYRIQSGVYWEPVNTQRICHGTGPRLIDGKTQQVRGKSQTNAIIESALQSAQASHRHCLLLLTVNSMKWVLSPILYKGHRGHFSKVSELLSGGTGPGTWIFFSLCPPPLDWATAQVTQMLEARTPSGETAMRVKKAEHSII